MSDEIMQAKLNRVLGPIGAAINAIGQVGAIGEFRFDSEKDKSFIKVVVTNTSVVITYEVNNESRE